MKCLQCVHVDLNKRHLTWVGPCLVRVASLALSGSRVLRAKSRCTMTLPQWRASWLNLLIFWGLQHVRDTHVGGIKSGLNKLEPLLSFSVSLSLPLFLSLFLSLCVGGQRGSDFVRRKVPNLILHPMFFLPMHHMGACIPILLNPHPNRGLLEPSQ